MSYFLINFSFLCYKEKTHILPLFQQSWTIQFELCFFYTRLPLLWIIHPCFVSGRPDPVLPVLSASLSGQPKPSSNYNPPLSPQNLFPLLGQGEILTLSGPGGGGILPPDFWQALQQKLEEPVTWIFSTFPKYVFTLTSKKKKGYVNPDRLAERGFKSAG